MTRALELALRGPAGGANPQVGCVLLDANGVTLAEGWHRGAGTAHAEVDALSKLAPREARGATAVVTLEPCNHTGRTGPCSEALIAAGIARVFHAVSDPNPMAIGGAERLREAGVEVHLGPATDQAESTIHGWLTSARLGRPYVTVKWAASLDGRAAAQDGTSQWITGSAARADVHRRRAEAGAIVAGMGTVLADDPSLTARDAAGDLMDRQPLAVVLGSRPAPDTAKVREHPGGFVQFAGDDLPAHLDALFARDIRSVFVEGGPAIASSFARAGLADEYLIYLAPVLLGGDRLAIGDLGIPTIGDARRLALVSVDRLGDDIRIVARPRGTRGALTCSLESSKSAARSSPGTTRRTAVHGSLSERLRPPPTPGTATPSRWAGCA
ncbi:bifunctional diaminohydroxyphosphoribosylaminopyrimidine deaminase/5-amino-6-(5-phosphoribosylamino)uracil reductase RibD [Naasia lichenicola]|uniref:bifunctional diaminohydroxyphosphoribosylaminopyrimidine deaminase/5-amino-6-(5-phosphoribosylamino)uracil reductase RibD n=1 Tax=Naasia lichenicola TaxID=2565933 RepID=UPI001E602EBE|nr:bifunctional diaminohydroxyphosphoribosylaminopyrimidine deaminase/5-amino-6-(5-phosphoribosylamino)uracil reductase RibD [Naasia lichenicola]